MTKVCALVLLGVVCLSLTACDTAPHEQFSYPEISDDIYSCEFIMEGIAYRLPVPYPQLKDNGWVQENDEQKFGTMFQNVPLKDVDITGELKKNNRKLPVLYTRMVVADGQGENMVFSVYWDKAHLKKLDVQLPGNITCQSTRNDIVDLLGLPDNQDFYGDYEALIYENPNRDQNGACIKFIVGRNGELEGILMRCIYNIYDIPENPDTLGAIEEAQE